MTLRLYDTAARELREFVPLEPGRASLYVCGATVQSAPHIGHVRSAVNFDVLRRWLEHEGLEVTHVRNVTDIDDKILAKAAEAGRPWWAWAMTFERSFDDAYSALGCLAPTYEPRATGHVTEMITLMQRLIDAGHAYGVDGDVYFDVRSWPGYGALSGQRHEAMQPAGDTEGVERKRDPRDFALWKSPKAGEPASASWPTPWGAGRPGWHLECSAMAGRYLGATFDIHGGGLDLIFPHHENELAQSAAAGDGFARYWLHNAWVTTGGEKMSKSLGNSLLVTTIIGQWRAVELRYYLGAAHYRSNIEYSAGALADAASAYRRIEGFVLRAGAQSGAHEVPAGETTAASAVPASFRTAMNDDLGVPAALAILHDTVRTGNTALATGDAVVTARTLGEVRAMTAVLGIDPVAWGASSGSAPGATPGLVDALVQLAVDQRLAARARRDFAAADAIRDGLAATGVVVEDTPQGPRWTLRGADDGAKDGS